MPHASAGDLDAVAALVARTDAKAALSVVLRRDPGQARAWRELGGLLADDGDVDAAVECCRRAVDLEPESSALQLALARALSRIGRLEEAVAHFQCALILDSKSAAACCDLALLLERLQRSAGARELLRRASALEIVDARDELTLGEVLLQQRRLDDALQRFERAIELDPGDVDARSSRAHVLMKLGRMDDAVAQMRQVVLDGPQRRAAMHSALVFAAGFHPDYGADRLLSEAQAWAAAHELPLLGRRRPHPHDRSPERRLRVGYVSPDFYGHCQRFFTLPVLSWHDPEQVEVICYSSVATPDQWTAELKTYAHQFHDVADLDDAELAERIRGDQIDVLVDLTMHMKGNRARTFAEKPAPVQICWLAYPGTTGLSAMDYRITDPFLDPPGAALPYTETSLYLPDTFWCYDPLCSTPLVNPLPALGCGHVTFGCLNEFAKIHRGVLEVWARVLEQVAGSRLLMLAPRGSARSFVLEVLGQRAVAPERVEFVDRLPHAEYLATYQRIDVGLDCFPVNGHTTSLDSTWMGVPVVTLACPTVLGRAGLCQAHNLGLPELVAETPEQFVQIAVGLGSDLERLSGLRRTLRGRLQASPLMDAAAFTRNLEAAYRRAWRKWCFPSEGEGVAGPLGHLERSADLRPDSAAVQLALAEALLRGGHWEQTIGHLQCVLALDPQSVGACLRLAQVYHRLRRPSAAHAMLRRVLALAPELPVGHLVYGNLLCEEQRYDEAVERYARVLELDAAHAEAHYRLGHALFRLGRVGPALDCYRRAAIANPADATPHHALVYCAGFHPELSGEQILAEARAWSKLHAEPLRARRRSHPHDRSIERRLKLGYVSPDFDAHCQRFFTLPLLRHHDHERFEITCYSSVDMPDEWTERIRPLADVWRDVHRLDDAALAEQIRSDEIDVLIDLTMHMAGSRLRVFAEKPAPVQICWLAYPGTTGLDAMDYRITDPHLDPPGAAAPYSEQSLHLPHAFWCYDPLADVPEVNPLPALSAGRVRFGCLNDFCKVHRAVLELWAQVLRQVPNSSLLLLAPEGSARQGVLDTLAGEGIGPERVEFVGRQPRSKYLETYHRIDLGLDCFPANGHTTSLDAAWMGVPVVTLVGNTVLGRAGLCQARHLGLTDLVAYSLEQFVTIAVTLSRDTRRLARLRASLRARLARSKLMDGAAFARDFEALCRGAWQRFCSGEGKASA